MKRPNTIPTRERIRQRSRNGFFRAIFGRSSLLVLLTLAQILLLFYLFFRWQYSIYAYGGTLIVGLAMVLFLINQPMDSHMRQTWLVLAMLFPVVGAALYLYAELDTGHRMVKRRLKETRADTAAYVPKDASQRERLLKEEPDLAGLAGYLASRGFPAYHDSDVVYYRDGREKLDALLEALESAERFIFLEYFIIDKGYMWSSILEVLERKANAGVEVRVMYDGTDAVFRLPYRYTEVLEEKGIQCRMFSPLRPVVSTYYNNRDHRKIAVIDGRCAFTGGINLADEYMNLKQPFGEWKDVACRVRGGAVRSFTLMFLQLWNVAGTPSAYEPYLGTAPAPAHTGYLMPFGDDPFETERVGETVFLDLLNHARRYVHIMTPYLILDETMVNALRLAAKRGVEVRLILPHIPDKKSAFALAYTHYRELMAAGVHIHEFTPGFVHAKVFVADGCRAVVGTINLDYRSLYLHFEDGLLLWNVPEIERIEQDLLETLSRCEEITPDGLKRIPRYRKVLGPMLKLFSPLM